MKKIRQLARIGFGLGLALAGAAALILLIFNISYAGRVFPRVYLGQIPLGGLNEQQLKQKITQVAATVESQEIKLVLQQHPLTIQPTEIGLALDQNATRQAGLAIGRRHHLVDSLIDQLALIITPSNINTYLEWDDEALKKVLAERLKPFEFPPVDAELTFQKDQLVVKPAKIGQLVDQAQALTKIAIAIRSLSLDKPITLTATEKNPDLTTRSLENQLPIIRQKIDQSISLTWQDKTFQYHAPDLLGWLTIEAVDAGQVAVSANKASIAQAIEQLAKKIDRPAKDARLKLADQKVEIFQPSTTGYQLDRPKAIERVIDSLAGQGDRTITLPVVEKPPAITTASVNDLGINELIGQATTSFAGSPDNRQHNIRNGAQILSGLLVPPNGEFSALASLGQIDDLNGFLPELVIKENKTLPEFGGGLCQVSTTLFRAALNTGLPITERRNHSWRISYYERGVGAGLDATVYSPAPDLKFKNDTPGWILIQGSIKGNEITFEMYGTKDGRRVALDGPKTLTSTKPPAPVYVETADLAQGETKQVEKPHPGGSAIATYVVYNADGSERNRQIFRSSYKAVPARFLIGTGPAPQPIPSPESPAQETASPESVTPTTSVPEIPPAPSVDPGTPTN